MELKCLQTKKYNYKAGKIKPNTVFKADNADKLRCGLKQCYVDCPVGNGVLNMELIKKSEIKVLSTPGVKSFQLLNPENSKSERITITKVFVQPNNEQPRHKHDTSEQIWIAVSGKGVLLLADGKEEIFEPGDVVRFADGDIHGLRNESQAVFEYISVTSPPMNFGYAYKDKK